MLAFLFPMTVRLSAKNACYIFSDSEWSFSACVFPVCDTHYDFSSICRNFSLQRCCLVEDQLNNVALKIIYNILYGDQTFYFKERFTNQFLNSFHGEERLAPVGSE